MKRQAQELHLCSLLLELAVEVLVAAPGAYAQLALRDDLGGLCHLALRCSGSSSAPASAAVSGKQLLASRLTAPSAAASVRNSVVGSIEHLWRGIP